MFKLAGNLPSQPAENPTKPAPMALIVPTPDSDPTAEEIIEFCAERLARFKLPAAVERIDVIPRKPTGKILKTELREPYWKDHERGVN